MDGQRLKVFGERIGLGAFVAALVIGFAAHFVGLGQHQPLLIAIAAIVGAVGLVVGGVGVFATQSVTLHGRFGGHVTLTGLPARGVGVGLAIFGLGVLLGCVGFFFSGPTMGPGIACGMGIGMIGFGVGIVSLVPMYVAGSRNAGGAMGMIGTAVAVVMIGGWGVASIVAGVAICFIALTR